MALRLSQLPAGVQSFRFGRRPRSDEDDRRGRRRRPEARDRCLRYAGRRGEGDEAGGGGRFAPLRGTLKGWGAICAFGGGENKAKIELCQVPAQIGASRFAMGMTHLTVGMAEAKEILEPSLICVPCPFIENPSTFRSFSRFGQARGPRAQPRDRKFTVPQAQGPFHLRIRRACRTMSKGVETGGGSSCPASPWTILSGRRSRACGNPGHGCLRTPG